MSAFLQFFFSINAQKQKEVYGSFEAGCKVFNYHFKQAENHINSFAISEVSNETILLDLDAKRLDTTSKFLTGVVGKITKKLADSSAPLPQGQKDTLTNLKNTLTSIIDIVKDAVNKIDSVSKLSEKKADIAKLIESSNKTRVDSLVKVINGTEVDKDFYSIAAILESLRDMMNTLEKKKPSNYTFFSDFELGVFKTLFQNQLTKKISNQGTECTSNNENLSSKIFFEIKARLDFIDDEPITAYLKLKSKRITVYISSDELNRNYLRLKAQYEFAKKMKRADTTSSKTSLDSIKVLMKNVKRFGSYLPGRTQFKENTHFLIFEVKDVSVEFEDGTIKNIFADLLLVNNKVGNDVMVRFRNNVPVTVSGKFDPERFQYNKIYAGISCETYRLLRNRNIQQGSDGQYNDDINQRTNCGNLFFLLSDLLEYLVVSENDKEDYSPANNVYHLNEQNAVQVLKKEKRSKLLVLKAYTDFIGIRDDQPNGLIQFEASKKLNFMTRRAQIGKTSYDGWLTYVEPRIVFSKLERNNKFLYLDSNRLKKEDVEADVKRFKVDPLDLLRYSNFNISATLNAYKVNWANAKSSLTVNANFGYHRTAVSDSVAVSDSIAIKTGDLKTDNINSGILGFTLIYELKPDSRFGIAISYDFSFIRPFSENYTLDPEFRKPIQAFSLDAFLKTNDDGGRLFFRTRFHQLFNRWNRNFMQVQLGYAMDVFKSNK